MALNVYKLRKLAALLLGPLVTTICYFIGLKFYGFIWSFTWLGGGLLISVLLCMLLLKNAFTDMLEGNGLLAINMDSTGVLQPFIVALKSPYIAGKFRGKPINDVFDRETVQQIAAPQKAIDSASFRQDGIITIKLDTKQFNEGRFAMMHYPVIIWNDQLNTILTKDMFSEVEKDSFAEHGILYLNRKMEELTSAIRDFGRYIVMLTKKNKGNWLTQGGWVWIVVIVIIAIIAAMFAPSIMDAIKGGTSKVASEVNTQPITPR